MTTRQTTRRTTVLGLGLTLGLVSAALSLRAISAKTDIAVPTITHEELARLGLALEASEVDESTAPLLEWRGPKECTWVYGIRVDESHYDQSVTRLLNREPEQALHHLALGRARAQPKSGTIVVLDAYFESRDGEVRRAGDVDPVPVSLRRTVALGPGSLGPAAPDAACRSRAWDHVEDALALGWPRLPAARVRAGSAWRGERVGGRCHRTACLDDEGAFEPGARACVVGPWRESLLGEVALDGHKASIVRSAWSDGNAAGVSTSRLALIGDDGRLLRASVVVEHPYEGVTRRIQIEAIDECGPRVRGLRNADPARAQQMQAALVQGDETHRVARP